MRNSSKIIILILLLPNIMLAKSYKIIIDPGHSYINEKKTEKDIKKVGPVFTNKNNKNIFGIKKGENENTIYDFKKEDDIDNGWIKVKDENGNSVGIIEVSKIMGTVLISPYLQNQRRA